MATEIPQKIVINCATGQREVVPLSDEEILEREQMALEAEAQRAAEEAAQAQKEADKQAGIDALKALGLTDAQIAALIS